MDQKIIFITIIGMALVTYLPRMLPVLALSSKNLPAIVVDWLHYVPPAVLAAMLLPSLLLSDQQFHLALDNLYLLAAIPTFFVAWKTRSLFGSVITGMLLVALGRLILG